MSISNFELGSPSVPSTSISNLKSLLVAHRLFCHVDLELDVSVGSPSVPLPRLSQAFTSFRIPEPIPLLFALMPDNPAFDCVFKPKQNLYFEAHPEKTKPFSLRIEPHLSAAELPMERIEITDLPPTPPWELKVPEMCFSLAELNKASTNDLIYQSAFQEVCNTYKNFKQIFTDGSKTADAVGAASVSGKDFKKPSNASRDGCYHPVFTESC